MDRRQVLRRRVDGEVRLVARGDDAFEAARWRGRTGRRYVAVAHVDPRRDRPLRLLDVVAPAAVWPRVRPRVDEARLPRGRRERRRQPRTQRGSRDDERPPPHCRITTGVPAGVTLKSRRRTSLRTRMQPLETARPIDHGSFVPWIATGPPCTQPVRTFE